VASVGGGFLFGGPPPCGSSAIHRHFDPQLCSLRTTLPVFVSTVLACAYNYSLPKLGRMAGREMTEPHRLSDELVAASERALASQPAGEEQLADSVLLQDDQRLASVSQLACDLPRVYQVLSFIQPPPLGQWVSSDEPLKSPEPLLPVEPIPSAIPSAGSLPADDSPRADALSETNASGAVLPTDAAPSTAKFFDWDEHLLMEQRLRDGERLPKDVSLQGDALVESDGSAATLADVALPPAAEQAAPTAAPSASELVCVLTGFFSPTNDPDIEKDRWMTLRTIISAMLAEPVINVFGGCELIEVELLAQALIDAVPSAVWIKLAPAVTPVVFVWQFLLLVHDAMDEFPSLCQAVRELLLFCINAEEQTMPRWEAKAGQAAKEYRDMWARGDPNTYKGWLRSLGIERAVSNVVAGDTSNARVQEQANEERTGQMWPGREVLRDFLEDSTAELQRTKEAEKRKEGKRKDKDAKKALDYDDFRHDYPVSVLRAPGVITFMCAYGFII